MDNREKALTLEVRKRISREISRSPGIHFRELQRRTHLAVGSLQYHLEVLQKVHLIKARKKGKFVRFFPVIGEQTEEEKETLSLLRDESVRKIVLLLLSKDKANNKQISDFLELSPSTVSFHLQKLGETGLIEKKRQGRQTFFALSEPEKAKEIIIGYRKSFLDEMVDSFVEVWQQM